MIGGFVLVVGIISFSCGLINWLYAIDNRIDELEERMIFG